MVVMPSVQCFRLVNVQNVITVFFFSEKSQLKAPGGLLSQQTHSLAFLSSTVRFRQVILVSSVDLEIGVPVRLREISTYRRYKM